MLDAVVYRKCLAQFATGVTIVTAHTDEPVGFAVNSFTSVSLEPPLILFCPGKTSETWPLIRGAGSFAVNILSADQSDIAQSFASKKTDRFRDVAWSLSKTTSSPILDRALAWLDCEIAAIHDAGDHEIVVGRVLDLDIGFSNSANATALVFYGGRYHQVAADV